MTLSRVVDSRSSRGFCPLVLPGTLSCNNLFSKITLRGTLDMLTRIESSFPADLLLRVSGRKRSSHCPKESSTAVRSNPCARKALQRLVPVPVVFQQGSLKIIDLLRQFLSLLGEIAPWRGAIYPLKMQEGWKLTAHDHRHPPAVDKRFPVAQPRVLHNGNDLILLADDHAGEESDTRGGESGG